MYLDIPPQWAHLVPRLEQAVTETLARDGRNPDDFTLSLTLADDLTLQELNRAYRGLDAPTDVLSFEMNVDDPQSGRRHLGDILISTERAAAQAAAGGHPVEAELILLTVHGVLHLLGYDHAAPDEKERMWTAQSAVLEALGLGDIQVSA